MPKKAIQAEPSAPRKEPAERLPPPLPAKVTYLDFNDMLSDVQRVKIPWSVLQQSEQELHIALIEDQHVATYVKIYKDLSVSVHHNDIPLTMSFDLENTKLCTFLKNLEGLTYCEGVTEKHLQQLGQLPSDSNQSYYRHVRCSHVKETHSSTVRAKSCLGVAATDNIRNICAECQGTLQQLERRYSISTKMKDRPLKTKTPLISVDRERLSKELKRTREEVKRLQKEKDEITKQLKTDSVLVTEGLHKSLIGIIGKETLEEPFLKLFWEEQIKAFGRSNGGMRWHPMLVRFAILLHAQSAHAYRSLRNFGILKLPGESTLREYTNAIHPHEGFHPEVIEEVKKETATLKPHQRWVVLLQDEMSIKSDLVHDRTTGEVVGFVDSTKLTDHTACQADLATHVLCFMVVGVNSKLKMSIGYFPTRGATADFIYPIFWRAVGILEIECGLKVVATTCDKATPNQKFIRMHGDGNVCFKTQNVFAPEREIFFISDVPHLVKTTRNNLYASRAGGTRYLWKEGHFILWDHVATLYNADQELYKVPLTDEHIYLTPHSTMRVNLAAQVLSYKVGSVMKKFGGPHMAETAKFILLMDRFFDCLNTRNQDEGDQKLKPDMYVYKEVDDARFQFLEEDFLGYLKDWNESVMTRPGFTKTEKNKMFLSYQTYEGLQISVKAIIEATQYLLAHGVQYIRTKVFCQDPLEQHFGRHRALGRRSDNPTLWGFGYQENKLRLQRSIALMLQPKGNTVVKRKEAITISDSPLKKRKVNNT